MEDQSAPLFKRAHSDEIKRRVLPGDPRDQVVRTPAQKQVSSMAKYGIADPAAHKQLTTAPRRKRRHRSVRDKTALHTTH